MFDWKGKPFFIEWVWSMIYMIRSYSIIKLFIMNILLVFRFLIARIKNNGIYEKFIVYFELDPFLTISDFKVGTWFMSTVWTFGLSVKEKLENMVMTLPRPNK